MLILELNNYGLFLRHLCQQHNALVHIPAYWLLYLVSGLSLFSGEWFCSFCRDLLVPEMEYESKPEVKTVKKEPNSEGGLLPEDKRVSALVFE